MPSPPPSARISPCGLPAANSAQRTRTCSAKPSPTDRYWPQLADVIAPQGAICSIVANLAPIDLKSIMRKCARFSWEAMFARSAFATPDMIEQHRILGRIAAWIDGAQLRSTATEHLAPINAGNLRAAHARVETGRMIGKIVVANWN